MITSSGRKVDLRTKLYRYCHYHNIYKGMIRGKIEFKTYVTIFLLLNYIDFQHTVYKAQQYQYKIKHSIWHKPLTYIFLQPVIIIYNFTPTVFIFHHFLNSLPPTSQLHLLYSLSMFSLAFITLLFHMLFFVNCPSIIWHICPNHLSSSNILSCILTSEYLISYSMPSWVIFYFSQKSY